MLNVKVYLLCIGFSIVLMVLFILINYPYYQTSYGKRTKEIVLRTVVLNSLAIFVGWAPVVYLWPTFSYKFLLPFTCILGALGCVGSRFIYHEIVPEELAKRLIELIEQNNKGQNKTPA